MILAFHASDLGSIPSFTIQFYILLLLFSVCFCCFYFDLFLSITASTIRQFLHLGIKSQKALDICNNCVQKVSLFLCSHSSCLHKQVIFDPKNEVFTQQNMLTGYIFHIICFSKCLKLLHLLHTKTSCYLGMYHIHA